MRTSGRTALLASPTYTGQAQGGGKNIYKREPKGRGALSSPHVCAHSLSLSSLHVFGSAGPHASRMYFPAIFKI